MHISPRLFLFGVLMKRYTVKVLENIAATPTVKLIRLKFNDDDNFEFNAGQFISVFVDKDGSKIVKPYSIASSPEEKRYIELCVKIIPDGYVSNYLGNIKPGTELMIFGPSGYFNLHYPIDSDVIFVATGSGISSFRPMIETLLEKNLEYDVWLLFGVKNENEIIYKDEFEKLAKEHKNFHFIPVLSQSTSDSWKGEIGHVQDLLIKYIKDTTGKHIYICGVRQMVIGVKKLAEEMRFDKDKIRIEEYV